MTTRDTTADRTDPADGLSACCVSCNRYIGPVARCPYCAADCPRPLALRILRIGSVLLAIAGVVWLYVAAAHRDVQVQKIGSISPLMNYACVRLVGTVGHDCYVGGDGDAVNYVSFVVRDGTGSVRVKARDAVALQLAEQDRLPKRGMPVDVTGSLHVVAGRSPELRLRAARHLQIGEPSK